LYDQGITTIDKLAAWRRPDGGKPIVGVSTIGAGTWIWGTYIFEKIDRGTAINFVAGGSTFALMAALSSGRFDGIMAGPDLIFQAAAEKWGSVAFDVTDSTRWTALMGGAIPASSVYALQSTIDDNPGLVTAYVKSILQALDWLKSSDSDGIIDMVKAKYLPNIDRKALEYGLAFHRKTMNFTGVVDPTQYARASDVWFRRSTGLVPVAFADAIEPRFLQAAQ
jgi:NitT/TauT family transport system substrate-binding protein